MFLEIERKFLLRDDSWRQAVTKSKEIRQGYLLAEERCSVRVRLVQDQAWLTIKGKAVAGATPEFEYGIPPADAALLLRDMATTTLIEKKRHEVFFDGFLWEIDEFFGANSGLVLAEIELQSADQTFSLPPWLGEEVSADYRFYNAWLARHPYGEWSGTA